MSIPTSFHLAPSPLYYTIRYIYVRRLLSPPPPCTADATVLAERLFSSKIIVRTDRQTHSASESPDFMALYKLVFNFNLTDTHTHTPTGPITLSGPLKWLVKLRHETGAKSA